MMEFLSNNWETIFLFVLLVVFVGAVTFLAARGKKEIVYKMLYALVNEAEKLYGSKTGKLKFAYVVEKVYGKMPAVVKAFITYGTLEKWIEKALAEAKEHWGEKALISDTENN